MQLPVWAWKPAYTYSADQALALMRLLMPDQYNLLTLRCGFIKQFELMK
jgi:hypothetical protein